MLIHIIGVKPGDIAAVVMFAFVAYCFHSTLLDNLRVSGLMESVHVFGGGLEV